MTAKATSVFQRPRRLREADCTAGAVVTGRSRPQCLQTIAAAWISSAQKGHFFIVSVFTSMHALYYDVSEDRRQAVPDRIVPTRSCWTIAPYFIVDDVMTTANYYRDKLGFHYERFWGDPPSFCMVKRRGIVIMLSQLARTGVMRPNRVADAEGAAWDAYIWVENADALYAEFTSKAVMITRDICEQPYGCRDFDVEDCNGYRLCFGHDIEG